VHFNGYLRAKRDLDKQCDELTMKFNDTGDHWLFQLRIR